MKIILAKDWDISIQPPFYSKGNKQKDGYFVGREDVLSKLTHEILIKSSGALLICGHRGVGKTSLVYQALKQALDNNRKIIPVLLNAHHLNAEVDNKDEKQRNIIENLIRRLYATTKDRDDLKEFNIEISSLYKKAVATQFSLIEKHKKQFDLSSEFTREIVTEGSITDLFSKIVYLVSWAIGLFVSFLDFTKFEWLQNTLSLLLALPIPYVINLRISNHRKKSGVKHKSSIEDELYQYDNNISNLEFDLERVHRKIKQGDKKIIYVIDELDKLEDGSVKELMRYFKNLFTLSEALFVFVGDEELFPIGASTDNLGIDRPREYTYFTSRYYLTRPLWHEISLYLEKIFMDTGELNQHNIEIIKRALCFDATNDFFDLIKVIKDRIIGYSDNQEPILFMNNISEIEEKARLHKAISVLLEDKYLSSSLSKWNENEFLIRSLFIHIHNILTSSSEMIFDDPKFDNLESELIRDANIFFQRIGIFKFLSKENINIRGLQVPINKYSFTGNIPTYPPDHLYIPTEYERHYLLAFQRFCKYVEILAGAYLFAIGEEEINEVDFWLDPSLYTQKASEWGFNFLSLFNENIQIYNDRGF